MVLPGAAGHATAAANGQSLAFADPAFQRVWSRTDSFVASGEVKRSFYWGPAPNSAGLQEPFAQGPGGKRLVQYFDKGRMEINDPNADPNNPFFVTPGLLTMEMVQGRVQVGNDQYMQSYKANIPVAGDADDTSAPTYASFGELNPGVLQFGENKTGKLVMDTATKDRGYGSGNFTGENVRYAYFEGVTNHNIPDRFWTFLNQRGPVLVNGKRADAQLSNPYFYATGYPVTEPYWSYVKIAGKPGTLVLIQLFERRVLTYVPSAPEGFKVQMGNIGQHYYDWRYKGAGKPDELKNCPSVPASNSLARLWLQNNVVQTHLLCPLPMAGTSAAFQQFEHGKMVFISTPPNGANSATKTIYVLFDGDSALPVNDTFNPSYAQPSPEPAPPGMMAPTLGFGKVWREHSEVRQRLGWAVSPERSLGQDEYMLFLRGFMVKDGANIDVWFSWDLKWMVLPEPTAPN